VADGIGATLLIPESCVPESITALARIALRESGADGCTIFLKDSSTGEIEAAFEEGTKVPISGLAGGDPSILSYPLRTGDAIDGILAFALLQTEKRTSGRAQLDQMAITIENVWSSRFYPESTRTLVKQIVKRERELVQAKILDRALGVLAKEPNSTGVDSIARHVESVLRPSKSLLLLQQLLKELEQEIEERHFARQAKAILQATRGMSEEEAHIYLQTMSRQTRKPIKVIAADLIEKENGTAQYAATGAFNRR